MEIKLGTPPLNFIMPLAWFAAIRSTPIKWSKVDHQSEKVLSCLPAASLPTPDHFVASPALCPAVSLARRGFGFTHPWEGIGQNFSPHPQLWCGTSSGV